MRVARYYGPDDVRLGDEPRPEIGSGELLVRVAACGICGSDTMAWYLQRKMRDGEPLVLGHEPAGEVVAAGRGVPFQPGERVFIHHHVPCGECHQCLRGHETLCPTFHATNVHPGGFAEYIRVPAPNVARDVLKLPQTVSYAAATLTEPLGCCLRGLSRIDVHPGDTAAVMGCGVMGLMFVQLLRLRGAGRIVAVDPVPFRRQAALRMGADVAVGPAEAAAALRLDDAEPGTPGRRDAATALAASRRPGVPASREAGDPGGADVVVICAGNAGAIEGGLALAGPGASVLLFAPSPPGTRVAVEPYRLFFGELALAGSYSAGPSDTREALHLLAEGRVQGEPLITHRFDLARAGEALRLAGTPGESLKVLVLPSGML